MKVRTLVVDDEPLARLRLKDLIDGVPWIERIGEAEDGRSAVAAIDALEPELLFLDVEMPDLSGLEVLEQARHRPAVIFTTAHDRYAVTAFDLQAIDYLLKPFGRTRFEAALERARVALDARRPSSDPARRPGGAAEPEPVSRVFVRERGRILPVAVADIDRLEADDDYVAVHVGGRRHLVHLPLAEFERRLDPRRFARVHRRHIVNLDRIQTLEEREGRLHVVLRDGTTLLASRARSRHLRLRASRTLG